MSRKRRMAVSSAGLVLVVLAALFAAARGDSGAGKTRVTIGVVQITLAHGYQKILNDGYRDQAKKLGANVKVCITNLRPSEDIRCAENLISGGAKALIVAPADKGSFKAVVARAKRDDVTVINDGSPQGVSPDFVPFTGTDSVAGGRAAGDYAVNWIKKNLGGKATVAEITLPAFTDCVNRNKGFDQALKKLPGAKIVGHADGKGLREKALPAMENMLQANPGINVVFGCNDDSALGAMSALRAKGKDPKKTLVIGFDGTLEAFKEMTKGGMFRADIVQRPDCYSRRMMDIAVKIARGEAKVADYVKRGIFLVKTPTVTTANVKQWLKWKGTPETAPAPCPKG